MKSLVMSMFAMAACIALTACMEEPPVSGNSSQQFPSSVNTSEPAKPKYMDPATSPEFQTYVNQRIKEKQELMRSVTQQASKKRKAPAKTATTYYYGLLARTGAPCGGTDSVSIYMDDEDDYNGSNMQKNLGVPTGSYSPVTAGANNLRMISDYNGLWHGIKQYTDEYDVGHGTQFNICVQSRTTALPSARIDYAVFRMGEECPPNSYPFSRYFHNESSNGANNNWYNGDISPQWNESYYSGTLLEFCFVPKNSSSNSLLWLEHPEQGVFAYPWEDPVASNSNAIPYCRQHGVILTDDEDDYNYNAWNFGSMSQDYIDRIEEIMSGGPNTQMFYTWCRAIPTGI